MEVLAESLKGLPEMVDIRLQKLKSMDRYSRDLLNKLNKEENDFLEKFKQCSKETFEEDSTAQAFQQLFQRRHDLLAVLDNQMKDVQIIYDHIDRKINYIGALVKGFHVYCALIKL
jgi:hypothetical protein